MRAWIIDDFKGIGGLRLADVPNPVPQPEEVILQVQYAALNPADRYLAENLYPAKPRLPHILGRDGIGTVVEVGSGVKDVRVGDRRVILRGEVGGNRPGTFAQRVAVPASRPGDPHLENIHQDAQQLQRDREESQDDQGDRRSGHAAGGEEEFRLAFTLH